MRPDPKLNMQETKEFLVEEIKKCMLKNGMFSTSTDRQNSCEWNKKEHFAMQQIQRNPPEGLMVSVACNHQVYDWTVVEI